jgi:catechol 2,3-dioxygenase-like lactoylglutathione lyase family enzyme
MAEQRVSLITLASSDLPCARRFYAEGFGWLPVFEADEILFYQLNGIILGLYRSVDFAGDMSVTDVGSSGGFALAHNVRNEEEVDELIQKLVSAGGTLVRPADCPPHGGKRGYVRDPDGHVWEIAFNPGIPMDAQGNLRFPEQV